MESEGITLVIVVNNDQYYYISISLLSTCDTNAFVCLFGVNICMHEDFNFPLFTPADLCLFFFWVRTLFVLARCPYFLYQHLGTRVIKLK